ncbi:hypothetical protein MD484_g4633, partial [Candolleomyces efflorescens]
MTLNTSPSLNELAVELRMLIISHMEPKELVTFGQVGSPEFQQMAVFILRF